MIVVTDGYGLGESLESRLAKVIAKYHPDSVILREKHLSIPEYTEAARQVLDLLKANDIKVYLRYREVAKELGVKALHTSYQEFVEKGFDSYFDEISVSVHSVEEGINAERLGATSLVTGHIFATECKRGLPPRGLEYLKDLTRRVNIPVSGIGGITRDRVASVLESGASDYCIMSSAMHLTF